MTGSPSVSIVIPVLNGAATIGDTLAGLLSQASSPTAEVLVVDNGSTDATRAIVEKFPVALLTETRPGPAAARNRGLQAARGAVVAHLDADTLPTRRWLAEIAAPFADPGVTQVAGRMLGYRPSTPAECYYAQYFLDREEENATLRSCPFAAAGNMAVRRDATVAVGGWDEAFRVGQDVDLSYRLRRRFPAPIRYQAGALVFVRTSRTVAELGSRAFKYGQGRAQLWLQYREAARGVRAGPPAWPAVWRCRRSGRICSEPHAGRAWPATTTCRPPSVTAPGIGALWQGFASMVRHGEWRRFGPSVRARNVTSFIAACRRLARSTCRSSLLLSRRRAARRHRYGRQRPTVTVRAAVARSPAPDPALRREHLRACRLPVRLFIHDDGSQADTLDYLRALRAAHDNVELLREPRTVGLRGGAQPRLRAGRHRVRLLPRQRHRLPPRVAARGDGVRCAARCRVRALPCASSRTAACGRSRRSWFARIAGSVLEIARWFHDLPLESVQRWFERRRCRDEFRVGRCGTVLWRRRFASAAASSRVTRSGSRTWTSPCRWRARLLGVGDGARRADP